MCVPIQIAANEDKLIKKKKHLRPYILTYVYKAIYDLNQEWHTSKNLLAFRNRSYISYAIRIQAIVGKLEKEGNVFYAFVSQ